MKTSWKKQCLECVIQKHLEAVLPCKDVAHIVGVRGFVNPYTRAPMRAFS